MSEQDEFTATTRAGAEANRKKYLKSRFYITRGLLMLLAGSVLLLCCKFQLPVFASQLLALAGGAVTLVANGYILFGLLIYADSRTD